MFITQGVRSVFCATGLPSTGQAAVSTSVPTGTPGDANNGESILSLFRLLLIDTSKARGPKCLAMPYPYPTLPRTLKTNGTLRVVQPPGKTPQTPMLGRILAICPCRTSCSTSSTQGPSRTATYLTIPTAIQRYLAARLERPDSPSQHLLAI